MIKTATEVVIPKLIGREGNESKVVHSEVIDIVIKKNGYSIPVIEWVFNEVEINDENGDPQTSQQKRILHNGKTNPSFRTFEQIGQLEGMLKSEATLTAIGMGALVGVYENLTNINEQLIFIMKIGHLLSNNQDQVRQVAWILSE